MTKTGKRILSVTVKRMVDEDLDTSYLGEYSDRASSEFSIDRDHSEDCASIEHNHADALTKLEHAISYLESQLVSCEEHENVSDPNCAVCSDELANQHARNTLAVAQSEVQECDCSGGD
jgi:hypothetical protein